MKYEFEKLLRQRKLVVFVTLALVAVYVYLAFIGSYDTFSGINLGYFWENEDYRQRKMSLETELVDQDWIETLKAEYKTFIDENMLQPEEVIASIAAKKEEGFQMDYTAEEVLRDPYNYDYAFGILPIEVFNSNLMDDVFLEAFSTYIPLAEDPVQYIHDRYDAANYFWERDVGISYAEHMGYSEAQMADYWDFIDSTYEELELTVGYCLGWDVLCTVMQFLPYTLGMVLIVVLGGMFSQERTENMVPILRTTKLGRSKLLRRKMGVAVVVATGLWLIFQMAMIIAVSLGYTLRGGTCTVMCFDGQPSLYGLNWIQYYLVKCAFSYLGTLVFALFVCCMSCVMKLRLSMPISLVITLLSGIPLNHFSYSDTAFKLIDKVRAITPAQLMAAHPTLQVYQSYEFGNIVVQLPYVMAAAIALGLMLMLIFLHHREGGR